MKKRRGGSRSGWAAGPLAAGGRDHRVGLAAVSMADSGSSNNGSGSNSGSADLPGARPGRRSRRDELPRPEPLGRGPQEDGGVPPVHAGQRCAGAARSQQDRPEPIRPSRPAQADQEKIQKAWEACKDKLPEQPAERWSAHVDCPSAVLRPALRRPRASSRASGRTARAPSTTKLVQAKHGADPPALHIRPARGPSGGRASFGLCVEDREEVSVRVLEPAPPGAAEIGDPLLVGLELTRVVLPRTRRRSKRAHRFGHRRPRSRMRRGSRRTCRRCRARDTRAPSSLPRSRTSLHRRHAPCRPTGRAFPRRTPSPSPCRRPGWWRRPGNPRSPSSSPPIAAPDTGRS